MPSDAVREAEWRAAYRAALKCDEIADIYQRHGGAGAAVAITALQAAAGAIRKLADDELRSGTTPKTDQG